MNQGTNKWKGYRWAAVVWALAATLALPGLVHAKWTYVKSVSATTPGASARGIAASADGNWLYLAGVQDKALWKIDVKSGEAVATVQLSDLNPEAWGKAVWVDAVGTIWAPGTVPELYHFDALLGLLHQVDLSGFGVVNPEGVAVDGAGNIYVTDRKGKGGVYKFRLQGGTLSLVETWGNRGHAAVGQDLRQPALLPNGDLVVGAFGGSTLYRIHSASGAVSEFATGVSTPFHVAVDERGRVYVVHYETGTAALTLLDPTGKSLGTYSAQELGIQTEASGVAVAADGKTLYVVDQRPEDGMSVRIYRWEE